KIPSGAIARGEWMEAEKTLDRSEDRSVIVDPVVNEVARDQRSDHHRGNTRAILVKGETSLVGPIELRLVTRGSRFGRRNVVIESAVFVPSDDEHAGLPERRVANRFIGGFPQRFS